MLQFFKKPGQKDKSKSLQSSPIRLANSEDVCCKSKWIEKASLCLEENEEEEICKNKDANIYTISSRLSKTLPQILADKNALGYFIQYMDSKDSFAIIKFWLEVECLCGANNSMEVFSMDSPHDHLASNFNGSLSRAESLMSNDLESIDYVSEDTQKSNNDMPKSRNISEEDFEVNEVEASNTRQDALRIYKKFIANNALGPNRVPEELKVDIEKALTCENTESLLKSLSLMQNIIYRVLEEVYVNDFLRSSFNCKHQIDVLTSGNVQLADILYDETAFFYFIEFMEQENKRELLDFWMSAVNYKQNHLEKGEADDSVEAQSDALIIYEKYFSLQATSPLGMSNRIRYHIEQNICREDGKGPQPDCFDKPCKIVYYSFKKHYLPAFLSSQLYYNYLSELISTIQNSMCSNVKPRLKRTDSDCSSEISSLSAPISCSQRNIEARKMKKNSLYSGSMSIDTKQLYDPDSLWKRNKKSLSVGYVDNMGRFITEIEPEPRRKHGKESRLSRAVKKLVHMEQDETKEELAWKIAEMIIGDITSQTLGASSISS